MARDYFNKLTRPEEETQIAPAVLIATVLIAFTLVAGIIYRAVLFLL